MLYTLYTWHGDDIGEHRNAVGPSRCSYQGPAMIAAVLGSIVTLFRHCSALRWLETVDAEACCDARLILYDSVCGLCMSFTVVVSD